MAKKKDIDLGQHHLRNFMGESQNRRVATNVQDPKINSDDETDVIVGRAKQGMTDTNTRKPGLRELDEKYTPSDSQPVGRGGQTPNPKTAPLTGKDKKEPASGNYPPTPGDNQEYPKNWNIPSDYKLG